MCRSSPAPERECAGVCCGGGEGRPPLLRLIVLTPCILCVWCCLSSSASACLLSLQTRVSHCRRLFTFPNNRTHHPTPAAPTAPAQITIHNGWRSQLPTAFCTYRVRVTAAKSLSRRFGSAQQQQP